MTSTNQFSAAFLLAMRTARKCRSCLLLYIPKRKNQHSCEKSCRTTYHNKKRAAFPRGLAKPKARAARSGKRDA